MHENIDDLVVEKGDVFFELVAEQRLATRLTL